MRTTQLGRGAVRTHPFAPDARRRPGKTAVRTALSPRYLIRPPWPGAATRDENRACPAKLGSRAAETVGIRAIFVSVEGSLRGTSCRRENRAIPSQAGLFSDQDEAAGSSPARPTIMVLTCGNSPRYLLRPRPLACVASAQRSQNASPALLSSDDFGSSVERRAKRRVLWPAMWEVGGRTARSQASIVRGMGFRGAVIAIMTSCACIVRLPRAPRG
jgi:hypothetical protein